MPKAANNRKVAIIDIGTNAVRLLAVEFAGQRKYKSIRELRLPVREHIRVPRRDCGFHRGVVAECIPERLHKLELFLDRQLGDFELRHDRTSVSDLYR